MRVRTTKDQADEIWTMPIEEIDVARPELFQSDEIWPYFERLRRDAPIHYSRGSLYGPYWSVTGYRDIVEVEANYATFSSDSALGGVTISDQAADFQMPMFIASDPPKHTAQRNVVKPIMSHNNLGQLEKILRERTRRILVELPRGVTFDWVDRVAVELTSQLLATLFDFPWQDRRKLTRWADIATDERVPGAMEARKSELLDCLTYFERLWKERASASESSDLISMMANADATRHMKPMEYLGNVVLLIIGGGDTIRNTITGGIVAMLDNPDQFKKIRENRKLVTSAVPEIIRWQTPLAHMRRTAIRDTWLYGQKIQKGEKVVLWYVSGNRDKSVIRDADKFVIDRPSPRNHLSFGSGIHRCVGERLGELALRILWEELLEVLHEIRIMAPPERIYSTFVRGYSKLLVQMEAE